MDWSSFKDRFKNYVRTTIGLFTLLENTSFIYFDLDKFLENQASSISRQRSITQNEMLMSLATFIDMVEMDENVEFQLIPNRILLHLKTLVKGDLLRLSPYSRLKKQCLNFMEWPVAAGLLAAPAA